MEIFFPRSPSDRSAVMKKTDTEANRVGKTASSAEIAVPSTMCSSSQVE